MSPGKTDSLRLMLKYAESHLAELVYSAWDTLLADRPGAVVEVHTSTHVGTFCDSSSDTSDEGSISPHGGEGTDQLDEQTYAESKC